ncbi:MAG: peptidoglycan DD-metalloendopeptidase family protein [Dehalococcoidia bacterium]
MFATRGPTISADGLQANADLSAPSTINQPQALAALEAQSRQYESSVASAQQTNPNTPLSGQTERLVALGLATPIAGSVGVSSSLAPSPTPVVSPTAQNSPTATPTPDCEPAGGGLYCVYTVKSGDTLSAIAKRFGISGGGELSAAEMLAESNKPAVVETNSIETGLKLRIPAQNGIIHTVFSSQTLSDVAEIYGVDADDITAIAANGIGGGGSLRVGQNILVPDPVQVSLPVAAAPTATATPEPEPEPTQVPTEVPTEIPATDTPEPEASSTPAALAPAASSTPRPARGTATPTPKSSGSSAGSGSGASRSGFIWPASGPISSYFGPSHPLGIDIDFYANPNQPVVAAAAGTVTFAGGDACCSYGYYVIIDHGNGFETLYAHFSRIAVSTGQKVTQGQTIGYGGHTGYATGDHLHFEVHLNGAIVNPLTYLP